MEVTTLKYAVLAVTFGSGFIAIGYDIQARSRGWPVGEWLSGDAPVMKIVAFVTMVGTLGISFVVFRWWSPIVVFGLGVAFGFFATQLLKSKVQVLAILGTVVGWVLCLFYVR